jgi:hypothetical protein
MKQRQLSNGAGWEVWAVAGDGASACFCDGLRIGWRWRKLILGVTVGDITAIRVFRVKTSFRSSMKSIERCSTIRSFSFCSIWVYRAEIVLESVWIPAAADRSAEAPPSKTPKIWDGVTSLQIAVLKFPL